MIELDDEAALSGADPSRMLQAVLAMPEHCREGYRAGLAAKGLPSGDGVSALVFCGMGGSGVSGDFIRALYRDRLGFPVGVVKSPSVPEYCGRETLVVCSSYSGDTAETLACFEEATARGCRVVAVTSGGELAARASEDAVPVVEVPAGVVAPRAAIGFLLFGLLGALEAIGVIPPLETEVEVAAGVLEEEASEVAPSRPQAGNPAKSLAATIGDRVPVVWAADGIGSVAAARWKTELNENAKVAAFSASLPELDHNEVVGWSKGQGERFFLVVLRHEGEHPHVAARFPISVEVATASGLEHAEVHGRGPSPLSQLLSLVMLGDATSVYLGFLRRVDPTPIDAIVRIKEALAGEEH